MRMVGIMKHLHERHVFFFFCRIFPMCFLFVSSCLYMNYRQLLVCIILSWLISQAAVTGLSWCILEPSKDDASWITVALPFVRCGYWRCFVYLSRSCCMAPYNVILHVM